MDDKSKCDTCDERDTCDVGNVPDGTELAAISIKILGGGRLVVNSTTLNGEVLLNMLYSAIEVIENNSPEVGEAMH